MKLNFYFFILIFTLLLSGVAYANTISNISLSPALDITYFSRYKVTADISGDLTGKDINLFVSAINGDGSSCWDYKVDGTCITNTPSMYNMDFNAESNKYEFNNIYPDTIYPEIVFGEGSLFWYGNHSRTNIWRQSYQIFKMQNSFSMDANMSLWLEFNTTAKSLNNSTDILIYLVGKGENLTYFESDWRTKPNTELVGTITRTQAFHHSHTPLSQHHLIPITSNPNGRVGTNNLDINNGEFYIVIYSDSVNVNRGWDLNFLSSDQCNQSNHWFVANRSGGNTWNTPVYQQGCPDVHLHIARREAIIDGAYFEVKVFANDTEITSNNFTDTFAPLPNLAPNLTSFTSPVGNNTYDTNTIDINWNEATDPNNDSLTYTLSYKEVSDPSFTQITTGLTGKTFSWDVSALVDGNYTLKGSACDQEPLCTDFNLDGYFFLNREDPLFSLTNITISSNNIDSNIAEIDNNVTLFISSTGLLQDLNVVFYSGGNEVTNLPTISQIVDTNNYNLTYTVNENDAYGYVGFLISASNLDQDYTDTTDDSSVSVLELTVENQTKSILYETIQEAIDAADNGDVIFVGQGTYVENPIIGKPLTLRGADISTVIIDGNSLGNVITVNASNVTIESLTTTNSGSFSDNAGIRVTSGYAFTYINDVNASSNNAAGIHVTSGDSIIENCISNDNVWGIRIDFDSNFTVRNCNILNNQRYDSEHSAYGQGIRVVEVTDSFIYDNNIISSAREGVLLTQNSVDNNLYNNDINFSGVIFGSSGIEVSNGSFRNILENNLIYDTNGNGINLETITGGSVLDNQVIDSSSYGINISSSTDIDVNLNFIKSSTLQNLRLNRSSENTIYANKILNSSNYGLTLTGSSGVGSNNNIIFNNDINSNANGLQIEVASQGNSIYDNNILSNTDNGIRIFAGAGNNNNIYSNLITGNKYGIRATEGGNLIYDNYFNNWSINAYLSTGANNWNISKTLRENILGGSYTGGNFWSNYSGSNRGDGFGDTPYTVSTGIFDNLPLHSVFNEAETYSLTVSKTGTGTGTITSSPSGIDCGSTCVYDFNFNTEVTLTAVATTGSTFTGWSGEGCSGTSTCVVTLSQARTVTANFNINSYTVNFNDWNLDVLKTETVNHGSNATAPSDPSRAGYTFTGWSPSDFTNITADTNITAQYTLDSQSYKNLVIIGASLMFNSFGSSLETPHLVATQKLRDITGINDLNVYGYGFSGLRMVETDKQDENVVTKLENAYQQFPNNDTLFLVHIGGNDITSMSPSRAYSLITPEQLLKFQSDLNAVFEKANERNNDVIISDITFRSYRNPLELNSEENFLIDVSGSGPYIENELRPRQIEHQPHFLNTDNKSVVDNYNFIRNNWTALLQIDGVHPNSSSYTAFQEFILGRVAYLFTDSNMPAPVGIDFNQHSDLMIIDIGTTNKDEYNTRSAVYHPINFSAITSAAPVTTLLKTITGEDVGNVVLSTSITDLNTDNIGVSTNTILPVDENLSYKDWNIYSKEIMKTALYFNEGESVTIKLTGLEINSEYDVNFVGSTNEIDGGNLKLKNTLNLNEDEILTTNATPEIGNLIAETNSAGELQLLATSSSGRGYLSGISVKYIGPVQFEEVIVGENSDAGVRYNAGTGVIQIVDLTNDGLHIGNRSLSPASLLLYKAIYVFRLPEIPSGKVLDDVTLSFYHSGRDGFNDITYDVDLKGIRYSSNSTVVLSDYNAEGTLIQESILTVPLSPPRAISTSETGNLNLKTWINSLYNAGATAGDYIFLRLEPDSIPVNITFNSFKVDSANNLDENKKPKLLLEYAINSPTSYTVNFNDWNGSLLKTEDVNNGSSATAPTDPSRTGYTFSGWDTNFNNITADLNVNAEYTINQYTITFDTNGGSAVSAITQDYNTAVTPPSNPTKTGYTFDSWSPSLPSHMPASNNTHTAIFQIKTYTLTYIAGANGSITGTTSQTINHGADGTEVQAIPNNGYYFLKWDDDLNTSTRTDTNIISNNTFTAIFQEEPSGDIYYSTCVPNNDDTVIYDMFGVKVVQEDILPVSGFIDFNKDLLGYWNFENLGNDNSTYDNNLQFTNSPIIDTNIGIRGKSLLLNSSSNQYTYVPYTSILNVSKEFTIEAWVKRTGPQPNQWAQIVNRNADNGFNLQHNYNNTLFEFSVRTNQGRKFINASPDGNIQNNIWYHVAGVYDGNFIRLYIDGNQLQTLNLSGNVIQSGNGLYVGARSNGTNVLDRFFNGNIDEVKLWNRALTEEEIKRSYNLDSNIFEKIYTDLDEGNYTFRGCITNSNGDFKCTETREVTVDYQTPEITITSPEQKTYIVDDVLVEISLNKMTLSCDFNLNGQSLVSMDRLDAYNFEYNLEDLDDGNYTLDFNCNDSLGNSVTNTRNFAVDTVPPMIVLETPLTLSYFNYQNIDFNFTPYKNGVENIAACKLFVGNTIDTFNANDDANYTWNNPVNSEKLSTNLTIPDGNFKWNVWCIDTADNSDWSLIGSQEFIVDLTPPVFTTVPTNQEIDYGTSFTEVTFIAEDDIGLSGYFLTAPLNGFTINDLGVLKNNELLGLGSYDINVGALDFAGNKTNVIFTLEVLDLTGPIIDVISPENKTYNTSSILIDIETDDAASNVEGIWYNWNGVDVNYTSPVNVTFSEGENTLNVFAVDSFNNLSQTDINFIVNTSGGSTSVARIFVMVGQSNMFGTGGSLINAPENLKPIDGVLFDATVPNVPSTFSSDWDTIGDVSTFSEMGPEVSFASKLKEAYPDDIIVIIKTSQAGTGLSYWRLPGELGHDTLMDRIDVVTSRLDNLILDGNINNYVFNGFISVQGENEANSIVSVAEAYDLNFNDLVNKIRIKTNTADLPVVLSRASILLDPSLGGPVQQPQLDKVREKQELWANNDSNASWVNTDDLFLVDNWHYGSYSQLELGYRLVKSWFDNFEIRPSIIINKDSNQSQKTNASEIKYIVNFSIPIDDFNSDHIVVLSETGIDNITIQEITPFDSTTYQVTLSGMVYPGVIDIEIPNGVVFSGSLENLPSISNNTKILYTNHPDVSNLILYDPFTSQSRNLLGLSSGLGWAGSGWVIQNNSINGYLTSNVSPLSYGDLFTSPGYASGGDNYMSSVRLLDFEKTFSDYTSSRTSGAVDVPGTTLWGSYLIKVNDAGQRHRFSLLKGTAPTYSDSDNMLRIQQRDGKWKVALMNTGEASMVDTGVSVVSGQTYLIVFRIYIGGASNPSNAYVWINPAENLLGKSNLELSTADVNIEVTNSNFKFSRVHWYPGSGNNHGSIDEIRIGTNFASVTPLLLSEPLNYTVNFNDWNGSLLKTETVNNGSSATAPTDPSRAGYTFIGWDTNFNNITADLNVNAQYTINQYTITFDSNGGSAVSPITQDYNTTVTPPSNPTRTGYTFDSWSPSLPSHMPASNNTHTAQWTINQYTITFDSNGGSAVSPITQDYNTTVTPPSSPTRTGYTFDSWSPSLPSHMPASNNTHTAQWTINQYTITFDTNGGSAVSPITQDYNTAVTPPSSPTKTGYTFDSWSPSLPSHMPASNNTHVAQYLLNNLQNTINDINLEGIDTVTLDINNSTVQGDNYISGLSRVKLSDASNILLEFDHNFLETNLDLSQITIEKTNTSIIVNLSNQLQNDKNKTIYLQNNNFSKLCVKDQPLLSISQISSSCNQTGEYDFTQCIQNGNYDYNGVSCVKVGDIFRFDNLRHSGVLGTVLPSSGSSGGSGGSSSSLPPSPSLKVLNIDLNNFCSDDLLTIKIYSQSNMKKVALNLFNDLNTTIYSGEVISNNLSGDLELFDTIKLSKGNYILVVSSDGFSNKEELFTISDCNVSLDTNEDNVVIIPEVEDNNVSEEDSIDNNVSLNYKNFKPVKSSLRESISNPLIYSLVAIIIILTVVGIFFIYFRKKKRYFLS